MDNFMVVIFKDGETLYPVRLRNGDRVIISLDRLINWDNFINEGLIPTYPSFDVAEEKFLKDYEDLIPKNSTIYIAEINNNCTEFKHYKYSHYPF